MSEIPRPVIAVTARAIVKYYTHTTLRNLAEQQGVFVDGSFSNKIDKARAYLLECNKKSNPYEYFGRLIEEFMDTPGEQYQDYEADRRLIEDALGNYGLLYSKGKIQMGGSIEAGGSIKAGGSILAGGTISAGVREMAYSDSENHLRKNRSQRNVPIQRAEKHEKTHGIVFISHSEKDKSIVDLLRNLLVIGLGIPITDFFATSLDGQGICAGDDIRETIREGIKTCNVVICVITPNYRASEPCLNELGAAWVLLKPMVGLVCEPIKPGQAAFLIDVKSQLPMAEESRLSSISDFLQGLPDISISHNASRWTSELRKFYSKLDEAILSCDFDKKGFIASTTVIQAKKSDLHVGYNDADYTLMIAEYISRERRNELTLHFSDLDTILKLPSGTSKQLMQNASEQAGYDVVDRSENVVKISRGNVSSIPI